MTKRRENISTLVVFLSNGLILAVCLIFFVPKAINNDDFIIHGITSGAYGIYSAVTVHTNIIYSYLLMLLQQLFVGINWFSVFEVVLAYLAFSLVTSIVILKKPDGTSIAIAVVLGVFMAFDSYIFLHNTKLAIISAAAGIVSFIFGIRSKKQFFSILGCIVSILASFLRLNAFLMGVVVALAVELSFLVSEDIVNNRKEKNLKRYIKRLIKDNKQLLRSIFCFFLLVFSFVLVDTLIISKNQQASYYRKYNQARGAVSDFAMAEYLLHEAEYIEAGITENDLNIIEGWNFADSEKFDIPTLLKIAEIGSKDRHDVFRSMALQWLKILKTEYLWMFILFTLLTAAIGTKKSRISLCFILAAFVLSISYMFVVGRFTHWVISGVVSGCTIMILLSYETKVIMKVASKRILNYLPIVVGAFLFVISYFASYSSYSSSFHPSALDIYLKLQLNDSNIYLIDNGTNPANEIHQIIPTFSALPKDIYINSYSLGGWDLASPAKESILERYGIEGSVYRALLEKDNVFLVDVKDYETKLVYLRQHYDEKANISLVDVIDGYYIFAFTQAASRFKDITVDKDISILETAVEVDNTNSNFTYCGVKLKGIYPKDSIVYLMLRNMKENDIAIYRARLITGSNESAIVTSIRQQDLLVASEYSVAVLFQTDSGYISSEEVTLFG